MTGPEHDNSRPEQRGGGRSPRQRVTRVVEKYIVNPVMRTLLRFGLTPKAYALLETKGRRTGKTRLTPIGNGLDGDVFWIVAEHGTDCAYVKNLLAEPAVRVKVQRRWRSGTASLVPDDDGMARRREMDRRNGINGRIDGVFFRGAATDVCTIRVDLDD